MPGLPGFLGKSGGSLSPVISGSPPPPPPRDNDERLRKLTGNHGGLLATVGFAPDGRL